VSGLIGRTIGRYTILEQIGQGGMSSVYRAVELTTNRQVAMKILSTSLAEEANFHARFEREIRLLRRLRHPNIIPILDSGEVEGLAYIVMPFMARGTLHERLQQGPLDPELGGRIVDQLASALTCAHENGVVHRDVKPSNVLLDEHGNALLSDFGFARPAETTKNLTGSALIGTPAYMSPEQCRGELIDARSDQYSFAIMLFQITTGQLPFDGETPMAVALKHVSVPLPRPRAVNPNLPEGVELVLVRALAKDSALRFPSIKDLNDAFQAELKAALDPRLRTSGAHTVPLDRTQELYRKYQNLAPVARNRPSRRPVVLATLLLLLACAVSAGAVAMIRPELFGRASAAPPMGPSDIQSAVDVVLTANPPPPGMDLPPGQLETAVYIAVMRTLEASLTPGAGSPQPIGTEGARTASSVDMNLVPTGSPSATTTQPASSTPSRTPVPSATRAATSGATGTPSSATQIPPPPSDTPPGPTPTSPPPSDTPPGPTDTPPPPSSTPTVPPASPTGTSLPPTSTVPPPTPTSLVCEWNQGGADIYGNTVSVQIHNTGDLTLHVSGVGITWTNGGETLRYVRLMGEIWRGWDHGPSFSVNTSKNIGPHTTRTLEFEFGGYHFDGSASVAVDAGC
jgi:serine/threonine protein kinase